jgi:selenium-binding protein 1
MSCCSKSTGYETPMAAFKNGKREKILYITAISTDENRPDALVTVDVDVDSPTFSTIIHVLEMPYVGDELHHTGWNACSSCFTDFPNEDKRRFLVLPGVKSNRVYFVDTSVEREPKIHTIVEPKEIAATGLAYPHTVHCLADGHVMLSYMGNLEGEGRGGFLQFTQDGKLVGHWSKDEEAKMQYGYDYWYQPRQNIMVSSEWGAPKAFTKGFDPSQVPTDYGKSLYFWDWKERKVIKKVDLGNDGLIPLEVRFLHNPESTHGYVAAALSSNLIHFYKDEQTQDWKTEKVVDIPAIEVSGWALPNMPALITDFVISLDDKYLYMSNWLHGDIRQYDISDPHHPKLAGQVFIGGSIRKGGPVTITDGSQELVDVPDVKGIKLQGSAQMIQLSLDGKRLYVTNSLFSNWDNQFYPEMGKNGSQLILVDVDLEKGGLSINPNMIVDFGKTEKGPYLAHESRYPGGDCTSDIWI